MIASQMGSPPPREEPSTIAGPGDDLAGWYVEKLMRASIITPSFNSLEYVEACVANVRSQGDAVMEHIIVDGGSTDGSVEKIQALQLSNPTLRYLPGPDQGQSDALNKGVRIAQGEVIGVLNADDSYQPGAVEDACRVLASMEPPAFVAGNCKLIDPQSSKWNVPKDLRFEALMLGYDYAQWPNNPAAYFYHAAAHEIVGYYDVDDHYTMDLDFIFRCARLLTTRHVARHWGNFYLHPGCKTFDDEEGPRRQKALFDRFHDSMSEAEKVEMQRIAAAKNRVLTFKTYLKRWAILRKINDVRSVK